MVVMGRHGLMPGIMGPAPIERGRRRNMLSSAGSCQDGGERVHHISRMVLVHGSVDVSRTVATENH